LRSRASRNGRRESAEGGAADDERAGTDAELDADEIADSAIERRGWMFVPLNERQLEPIEGALVLSGYDLGDSKPPAPNKDIIGTVAALVAKSAATSKPYFAVRPHGLGAIAAFRGT
jgi:hypothetical protein